MLLSGSADSLFSTFPRRFETSPFSRFRVFSTVCNPLPLRLRESLISTSALVGMYVMLFGMCIYIFRNRKARGHKVLLVVASLMFMLSTVHMVLDLVIGLLETLFALRRRGSMGAINPAFAITNPMIYVTNK